MEAGKIKNKRNHNSKPYDRGQSFIGKLTRAVIPNWISQVMPWKSPNESAVNEENAEHESNLPDSNFKRPQSRQCTYNNNISEMSLAPLPSTSASGSAALPHLPRLTFNKDQEEILNEGGVIDDDNEDEESVSTSGCSSMVPNVDHQSENQREVLPSSESDLTKIRDQFQSVVPNFDDSELNIDMSLKSNPASLAEFRASGKSLLWSEQLKHNRPQRHSSGKRPSFNISAFGSPFYGNKSRMSILNDSSNDSIFYPGKTSYGGAASQRKPLHLHSTAPYEINSTKRQLTKVRAKQNHKEIGLVSSTAKRILKSLEEMSTPLSDAQKIPSKSKHLSNSILSFSPSRKFQQSNKGPPVNKILTPSLAKIQKRYVGINSSNNSNKGIMPTLQSSAQFKNVNNISSKIQPATGHDFAVNAGGKMKSRPRESLHYSSKQSQQNAECEEAPPLELPAETLNVKTLPKISFGSSLGVRDHSTPIPSSNKQDSSKSTDSALHNEITSTKATICSPAKLDFAFTSPLMKQGPKKSSSVNYSPEKFHFASPKFVSSVKINNVSSHSTPVINFSSSSQIPNSTNNENVTFSKPEKPFDAGKRTAAGSMFKVPEPISIKRKVPAFQDDDQPKKENMSEYLKEMARNATESQKTHSDGPGFGSQFSPASGSWDCKTCLIVNKSTAVNCVACQSTKPNASVNPKEEDSLPAFKYDSTFQPSKNTWECSTCLVQNKNDVSKCVACGTVNPSSNNQASLPSSIDERSIKSSFVYDQKFKPKQDVWDCSTCLIQNSTTSTKCVACGADNQSNSTSDSCAQTLPHEPMTNLPSKSTDGSASTWECDTCLIRNKSDVTKCIACESNRPGLQTSSKASGAFTFGMSSSNSSSGSTKFGVSNNNNISSFNKNNQSATAEAGFVFKPNTSESTGSKSAGFFFMHPKSEQNDNSSENDSSVTTGFKFTEGPTNVSSSSEPSTGFVFKPNKPTSDESTFKSTDASSSSFSSTDFAIKKPDKSASEGLAFSSTKNESENKKLPTNDDNQFKPSAVPELDASSREVKKDAAAASEGSVFGSGNLQTNRESNSDAKNIKPGFMFGSNASAKAPAGGFVFGASGISSTKSDPKTTTNVPASSSFNFAPAPAVPVPCSLFGSTPSETKQTVAPGGFSFGSTPSEAKPIATSGGFSFGSSSPFTPASTTLASSVAADQPDSSKSLLASSIPKSDAPKPLTGGSLFSSVAGNSSAAFSFGQSSTSSTTTPTPTPGLFTFGQSANSAATPSVFNAGTTATTTSSTSEMFRFGAGNIKTVSSLATTPITTPQTFSFGENTPAVDTKKSSEILSSSAGLPVANFSFSATPAAPQNATEEKKPPFGSVTAPTFSVTSSNFSFGSSTATTTSTPSGVFTFGAQPSTIAPNIQSSSSFNFGASNPSTFGQPPAQPSFNFGGSAAPNAFGANSAASSGPSMFGSTTGTPAGTGSFNPTPGPTGSGPFGSTITPSAAAGSNPFGANVNPAGNFGTSATPADASSVFRFSASPANQPALAPAPSVFSGSQPAAGFNFTPGATLNTNFAAQPPQGFAFTASGTENPFNVQQQSAIPGRKIRRANRRIKK